MFGNVAPALDALSEQDKALFRGYYCSLCREIGRRSQPARLGLSYDMTFLAILLCSLDNSETDFDGRSRCALHPFKAAPRAVRSKGLSYAADMSVLLIKAKLADDAADEKNPLFRTAASIIRSDSVCGRTREREIIASQLAALAKIEKENVKDPDAAADCFAVLCAKLFSPDFTDEKEREALYWLGYNIGRWVYLLDAYEDLEHDLKKGCYNPFAEGKSAAEFKSAHSAEIEEMLYFTLSSAAAAFDLLPVRRYKALLENIIYIGLNARQNYVLHGPRKEKGYEPI